MRKIEIVNIILTVLGVSVALTLLYIGITLPDPFIGLMGGCLLGATYSHFRRINKLRRNLNETQRIN